MEFAAGFFLGAFLLYLWQDKRYRVEIEKIKNVEESELEERKKDLEDFSDSLLEKSKNQFNEKLQNTLKEHIGTLKDRTIELSTKLETQAENLTSLEKSTKTLREAMGGNTRISGDLGELALEALLNSEDLQRGVHYEVQQTVGSGRPDIILNLDQERKVIIDSKFITKNWLKFIETKDPSDLKKHTKSLRDTITTLGRKNYQQLKNSYSYVLMYIPIDAALLVAQEHDKDLSQHAKANKVMLASPLLIMPILRTIHKMWIQRQMNENSQKLIEVLKKVYEKYVGFDADMTKFENAFKHVHAKLKGTGGLESLLRSAKKLGLDTKKQLKEENQED
ncbi:hypothetical protein CL659_01755 [bacterium]|nr:hypothetical protein [bacterium]|tara:strand:- start:2497 stop:3501 length:1005 start_codon:yes stop_codon:yes gene_type:complete